jgi:hypothetical protein
MSDFEIKAGGPLGGLVPQEIVTARTRGYGPRRGNLERLLRYWRPIMRKPGGFRRCRVILANHPELYPLERICAWLHHETTGLWPNEGCHHPGMKNCKGKLKKLKNWSDADFARRLSKRKSDDVFFAEFKGMPLEEDSIVTGDDYRMAAKALKDFVESEPKFSEYVRNHDNWEIVGDDISGMGEKSVPFSVSYDNDCCGGLDGLLDKDDESF